MVRSWRTALSRLTFLSDIILPFSSAPLSPPWVYIPASPSILVIEPPTPWMYGGLGLHQPDTTGVDSSSTPPRSSPPAPRSFLTLSRCACCTFSMVSFAFCDTSWCIFVSPAM